MEEKKINNISSVCVYCASSTKIPRFILTPPGIGALWGGAKTTGSQWCREYRFDVRCPDAALAAGGTVTGVIPILWWSRIGIIKA